MQSRLVELPGPCVAAAAGGDMVWCVAGGRLLGFAEQGTGRLDVPLKAGVRQLAASGTMLAAALDSGAIGWFDGASGRMTAERRAGEAPEVV
ncbi:MAG: hypothetical protein HOP28_07920, partial [Gemmatimonadales bacterium]|nr:hypothetical protein [Gemmatimonadales bacterium]